jgi:hypothetical protein
MFRSLAYAVYGEPEQHLVVRAAIVKWLEEHSEVVGKSGVAAKDVQSYLKKMSEPHVWGTQLELWACGALFNMNVETWSGKELRSNVKLLVYTHISQYVGRPFITVSLYHKDENHYDVLRVERHAAEAAAVTAQPLSQQHQSKQEEEEEDSDGEEDEADEEETVESGAE